MTVNGHGWEAQYRQALLNQPSVSKITLADGQLVQVKDIYVNRTLLHEVVQKPPDRVLGEDPRAGTKDAESQGEITVKLPVELWPKLRDERVVLVEGPAGMGKSTFTKHLVQESGTQHLIPIWIPFRQFVASGLSIAEYLDQYYVPWLGLSDLRVSNRTDKSGSTRSLGQWCYDQWQSGLGVLILDGLDEVFRHEERVAALKGLTLTGTDRTRPATILTSRPLSQSIPLQLAKVDIQGLTLSDQREFIEQYRASLQLTDEQITRFTSTTQKQEQSRLQSLLSRPGHLIQILTTYATTNTILDTETAVLDQLLQSRLSITGRSQPPVEGDDAQKKRQLLLSLALHFLACRQGQRQTRAQLLALIQQVLREHASHGTPLFPFAQATALQNDLTRNSGLLTEIEPEVYEFETVIWLQHLTGTALANRNAVATLNLTETQVLDFLNKKAWDPEWGPVLKSWVGHAHNPLPLLDRLMQQEHDDLARHRLGVAGSCLAEVQVYLQPHSRYEVLAERIPIESFAVWKTNGKRHTEKLVAESLGWVWVETAAGQTKLLALLQSPRSIMRRQVLKTLSFLQPILPRTMQSWVDEVAAPYRVVRENAARALGKLGAAMPVFVQQVLVARLADPDNYVRSAAARALGKLGTSMPVSAQQALVARLVDPDRFVRAAVVEALVQLGAAMPVFVQQVLVARLADPDDYVRTTAARALGKLGTSMPVSAQQALVARLVDPDSFVRAAVVEALGQLGAAMPGFVQQALVTRLEDPDWFVRAAAGKALRQLGAAMPVFVKQALMVRLAGEDPLWYLHGYISTKRSYAFMSVPEQQALVARLADSREKVREASVRTLQELEAAMPDLVQRALVAWLADSSETVRRLAVEALWGLGAVMPAFVQQALVAQLADPSWTVRVAACRALGDLGTAMPECVQLALTGRLADLERDVRVAAGEALGELRTAMPVFVQQVLLARLTDPDETVRMAVAWALWQPSTTLSVRVKSVVVARLADQDKYVRCEAVKALGGLGAAMPVSVQLTLMERLADPESNVRREAVKALGGLGTAMSVSVQLTLVEQLADSEWTVCKDAGAILGRLGTAMAIPVQRSLAMRLEHSNRDVRRAACEVLASAQQQGLRLFLRDSVVAPGRLVSELSATASFSDGCHVPHRALRSSASWLVASDSP